QHGNPDVRSEKLKLAEHTKDILATKNGKVADIDMKALNLLARTLGAPLDLKAGVYLYQKLGGQVKKGEKLFAIYADEESKIDLAREFLEEKHIYTIK
ncbi:MAG: thymidine phosphorylase, partial [bacterium]